MGTNKKEIETVADQMKKLHKNQISMISFLIDGYLLENSLEAMEGEHGEIIKTADYQTARASV